MKQTKSILESLDPAGDHAYTPAPDYVQPILPILDIAGGGMTTAPKVKRRRVDQIQTEIRRLAEELNDALYTSKKADLPAIHSPADAAKILLPIIGLLDHEELWIVILNVRNRILKLVRLYSGSVNSSQVRISEVFRQAVIENGVAIIVAHNHPSGDPLPSPDDVALTRAIVQSGKLLDIDVLDHLVIGSSTWVSLKERGLGF